MSCILLGECYTWLSLAGRKGREGGRGTGEAIQWVPSGGRSDCACVREREREKKKQEAKKEAEKERDEDAHPSFRRPSQPTKVFLRLLVLVSSSCFFSGQVRKGDANRGDFQSSVVGGGAVLRGDRYWTGCSRKSCGISSLFPVFQTFFAHGRREEGGVVVGRRRSGDKAEEEDCQYNSHHRRGGSINKSPPPSLYSPLPPSIHPSPPNSTATLHKKPSGAAARNFHSRLFCGLGRARKSGRR